MPFSRPSLTTLIDRIEADIVSRLLDAVALLRNSLLKIIARVLAGAMHTAYGYLDFISKGVILGEDTEEEWVTKHAYQWGVNRIASEFASGDVIFTGINGTAIPVGTLVVRDDGVEFATTIAGLIASGSDTVNVEAVEPGEDGNTVALIEMTISVPINNIDDVCTVSTGLVGGVDLETVASWITRTLARIQNPPAGGAAHDYRDVSRSVAGVAEAFVFGNQNGLVTQLGYVTVVILGVSPLIPSAGILTAVENALTDTDTGIVPVTATLVVEPVTTATINFLISITPNTSDYQTLIEANLESLLELEGEPGGIILLSKIRDAISTSGVDDYEITDITVDAVSNGVADVDLNDFDYPLYGNTTFASL